MLQRILLILTPVELLTVSNSTILADRGMEEGLDEDTGRGAEPWLNCWVWSLVISWKQHQCSTQGTNTGTKTAKPLCS